MCTPKLLPNQEHLFARPCPRGKSAARQTNYPAVWHHPPGGCKVDRILRMCALRSTRVIHSSVCFAVSLRGVANGHTKVTQDESTYRSSTNAFHHVSVWRGSLFLTPKKYSVYVFLGSQLGQVGDQESHIWCSDSARFSRSFADSL